VMQSTQIMPEIMSKYKTKKAGKMQELLHVYDQTNGDSSVLNVKLVRR
jgi:hypothetical protein